MECEPWVHGLLLVWIFDQDDGDCVARVEWVSVLGEQSLPVQSSWVQK